MTDAEFEGQKARVLAVAEKWLTPLWLRWWTITYYWERAKGPERPMDSGVARWETAFKCNAIWNRLDAAITAYLGTIQEIKDGDLEMTFVHECMHLLVNETRQPTDGDWLDHEERVCTVLAKALVTVRDQAREGKL